MHPSDADEGSSTKPCGFKLVDSLNTGYVRDLSFERVLFGLTYCVVKAIYSSIDNYTLSRQ